MAAAPNVEDVNFHPNGLRVTWREVRFEVTCHACFHRVQVCAGCYQPFALSLKITHKPICKLRYDENKFQRKTYRSFAFLDLRDLSIDPRIYS